jgi:hypothetical protein
MHVSVLCVCAPVFVFCDRIKLSSSAYLHYTTSMDDGCYVTATLSGVPAKYETLFEIVNGGLISSAKIKK